MGALDKLGERQHALADDAVDRVAELDRKRGIARRQDAKAVHAGVPSAFRNHGLIEKPRRSEYM